MKFTLQKLELTVSTNDDAKQAAENGGHAGLVIWALQQSSGRGRHGRQWFSPAGNLYFSIILRPQIPQRDYGHYSFIAALAIYDAVLFFLPQSKIELKWPNDVLVEDKKISGILLEAGDKWLVVGIGFNVLLTPDNPLYPTTSLAAQIDAPPSLDDVLNKILKSFGEWSCRLDQEGFSPVRAAWLSRARKGPMRIRSPHGEVQGKFKDLDENGNLCIVLNDGTQKTVSTGDVFF